MIGNSINIKYLLNICIYETAKLRRRLTDQDGNLIIHVFIHKGGFYITFNAIKCTVVEYTRKGNNHPIE